MVKTTTYTQTNDYLIAPELAFALSCRVADTGVTADDEGRKIIKAGTPLYIASGSILTDRDSELSIDSTGTISGIARHDIDVTYGTANDAVLIDGYVDIYKLDETVQAMITDSVISALPDIRFIKGAIV